MTRILSGGIMTELPPFLKLTEPLELDQLPLQVALLTMELASLRAQLADLAALLTAAGAMMATPEMDLGNG